MLPFLIAGLVSGSVYGFTAMGLVLAYKTSGIMNLGYGAIGAAAAYIFYALWIDLGIPWPFAFVLTVGVVGATVGIALELFARRAINQPSSLQIAGTVGIILLVRGVAIEWKGQNYIPFPYFLPHGTFKFLGAYVSYDQVITVALGLLLTAGLYAMLKGSRLGHAMRGVVDDPALVGLSGISPVFVRRWAWMIGSMLACLSGVLLAPSTSLQIDPLIFLVVTSFGAAAIGGFSSLPWAYVGGLVVGVGSSLLTKYINSTGPIGGLPSTLPFIVLFFVLILVPRNRLLVRQSIALPPRPSWKVPRRVQIPLLLAALGGLIAVPHIVGIYITDWTASVCFIVLFLALGLLVKTSNQVSLCAAGFAAVGAAAFGHLSAHMPWGVAVLLSGLILVPIGAIVAIPAIRVSGVYLALATLGFGIGIQYIFFQSSIMFGSYGQSLAARRPDGVLGGTEGFYYLVLGIAIAVIALMVVIHRSRLGRLLRGLSDSRLALSTLGASPNVALVTVFCISAFLTGIFGAIYGSDQFAVDGNVFPYFNSLTYLVILSIVAGTMPWYAFAACAGLGIIPAYLANTLSINWFTAAFGVFAIGHAMFGAPVAPAWVRNLMVRLGRSEAERDRLRGLERAQAALAAGRTPRKPPTGAGLLIEDLTVRFSGVLAVDTLSLAAPLGRVTGLIGPNGAGKTTTFNACSGLLRPSAGRILLNETDVSSLSPAMRARHGLGRTFQRMQLFESLTVGENVALGSEAGLVGRNAVRQLVGRPGERSQVERATVDALDLCGITELRFAPVTTLSTGQRRLVELARALAGDATLLLLDEPSSGLNASETERFGGVLTQVVEERGTGILLVEHDMSLVMAISNYIHVLDFGRPIFQGTPTEVQASEIVRAAYLGADTLPQPATNPSQA